MFWIGGETDGGNEEVGMESGGEEEFVVIFAFALAAEGGGRRVHKLDGD